VASSVGIHTTNIPALDLSRAVARLRPEVEARWRRLLDANAFVGGAEVAELEEGFSAYLGSTGCVGVANGTDALLLSLRALGLEPGDEVIVPAFTFVATAATVSLLGGVPVFADVEPGTLNLDLQSAAESITDRTVGIVGVHLYGCPFDTAAAQELCSSRDLWLLEDAAQAQGATVDGKCVGNFGRLAAWSFYPTKNLGAFGDAGAITGNDRELLEYVRRLANHGAVGRYRHAHVGTNSRLDALQAAVLNCRLAHLEEDNRRRREIAALYRAGLGGIEGLQLPEIPEGRESVFHQYTVLAERRDELQSYLAERGVGTAVHYPEALHLQQAFADLPKRELPVASAAGALSLCLPMFPELRDDEVGAVCEAVRGWF
jgi:dTDP-4-amino-4,6-dideoxygalactose transaminase